MSSTAKTAREAMKDKAKRLAHGDPKQKVDSSTWTPPEPENAGVKTGARPLTKRLFKKGGKVVGKCEGGEAMKRGDRKPRKSGGRAERYLTPDNLINRDVRMANDVREGEKHIGAFKKGGKVGKFGGGPIGGNNPVTEQNMMLGRAAGMQRKHGGRLHKEKGGDAIADYLAKENTQADVPLPPKRPADLGKTAPQKSYKPAVETPPDWTPGAKRGGRTEGKWIQSAIKHPGALHKALHVKEGEKIPAKKLHAAEEKGGKLAKRAHLAETLKKMHHAKGGKAEHYSHEDEVADRNLVKKMVKPNALTGKKHGGSMHHEDCTCKMCGGGRTAHARGGKTGKGKTNIVIAINPHPHQEMGAGNMPNAPMPAPRAMPVPPPAPSAMTVPAGMPAGGAMPPAPPPGIMPRKSGGRTTHVIDHAAGGGLGRLEKIKAYGLKP